MSASFFRFKLSLALLLCAFSLRGQAQDQPIISDFYTFANQAWLDSVILPENAIVINHVGELWELIEGQAIGILIDSSHYDLDPEHTYVLTQARNFYSSTKHLSDDPGKRFSLVQEHLPFVFGAVFAKVTITPQREARVNQLIADLKDAYRAKISNSARIDAYHRELLLLKLEKMEFRIGAPPLSLLPPLPPLSKTDFEENLRVLQAFSEKRKGAPLYWPTAPCEADCYYLIGRNQVVVNAGALFDLDASPDAPMLYATLGRTLAHEMTHAFDTVGRHYDASGRRITGLRKLFTGGFLSQVDWDPVYERLIDQFNHYSLGDSLVVDGRRTLQENLADLGGVEVSFLALNRFLDKTQPHLTPAEREAELRAFFLAYARYWRQKANVEFQRTAFQHVHSPAQFRAIGPVHNLDVFYQLFPIDPDSPWFIPEDQRVVIW